MRISDWSSDVCSSDLANIKEVGSDYLVAMPWDSIDWVLKVAIDFDATTQIGATTDPASRTSHRAFCTAIPGVAQPATGIVRSSNHKGSRLVRGGARDGR